MRARALSALGLTAALGLSAPALAAEPPEDGHYFTRSGERVPFEPMYESWFGSDRYRPNYWRALLENAAMMALEVAIYWYDPSLNVVDWQFPDLDSKLSSSEAVRFDDNLMPTNYLHHPTAGTAHYLLTRVNGFGVLGAFTAAAASSTAYELVFEWRELVSVNDLIVTPFGGMALGEFFNHLNGYLNSAPPRVRTDLHRSAGELARDGAQVTFGALRRAHDSWDEPAAPLVAPEDNLGLSSAYAHVFRLRVEQSAYENDRERAGEIYGLAGDFRIVAMPGFLAPGRFARWYVNGNFTELAFRVGFNGSARENELVAESHLLGWYSQAIGQRASHLRGHALESALATGLTYVDRQWAGQRDQYGIIHFPHPSQRVWWFVGPAKLAFAADVAPDFASLHSAAYRRYAEQFGTDGTKSSLKRHGYFHGLGVSAGASASVAVDALELGTSARFGHYESIEGLERRQEEVTRDTHGVEQLWDLRAHLQLEPEDSVVSARVEVQNTRRSSRLAGFRESDSYKKLSVSLGVAF
jgi:hypothetical protein